MELKEATMILNNLLHVCETPSKKIEFSLDGQLYDVEKRSDVGRIISFKENKSKM